MRVLVAMSGGVDSSVAAALLTEAGHDVTGVTMRLWGGESDSGCCSVSDVEDARRVAAQLGIDHYVFNFADDFERRVVDPYVAAYAAGRTPNPCVDCNRYMKWGRLLERARELGYDALATGHHARVISEPGKPELRRGADEAKDQSYVLAVLRGHELAHTILPVGHLTKLQVREHAARLGLRTAAKAESMDVCFITRGGRAAFIDRRIDAMPGTVVDSDGNELGVHEGVTRFTLGQRRGVGIATGQRRYVVDVDAVTSTVTLGRREELATSEIPFEALVFTGESVGDGADVLVQCSAHGAASPARLESDRVRLFSPRSRVAPGQLLAFYDPADPDLVLGSATAAKAVAAS